MVLHLLSEGIRPSSSRDAATVYWVCGGGFFRGKTIECRARKTWLALTDESFLRPPTSSLSSPLFPDGFFFRDVLTIEIARGRDHGSFLRAVSFQKNLFPPSFQFLLSSLASFFPCLGTERTVVPCRRG